MSGETGAERIIRGDACVAEGAEWLAARVPEFAAILPACLPLPLRLRADGFAALAEAITGQQVSVASAAAISARLRAAGFYDAAKVRGGRDGGAAGLRAEPAEGALPGGTCRSRD